MVGYPRVSTRDQNLDLQRDALSVKGGTQIFSDRITEATQVKEGLASALSYMRENNTLIVWKLTECLGMGRYITIADCHHNFLFFRFFITAFRHDKDNLCQSRS